MKREIMNDLILWKNNPRRKPLLLLGVRQCGKTYVLKEFGEHEFENVCYINMERNVQYHAIFDYDFDIERIIKEISLLSSCQIETGKTLLILDEIQACPKAITSLKYFSEDMPKLHVACAGSLLGVALKYQGISFPVGKVNRLQMYPMNFKEFAMALGYEKYLNGIKNWDLHRPLPELYTMPLEKLLKDYYIIGGMPEAVASFASEKNYEIVDEILDGILSDYEDDFSKHVPVQELEKVRLVWNSIPVQLAKDNNKFVFSHVKQGKRAHELEAALQWLKNAGLIYQLELVEKPQIPLSAYSDKTFFKVYMSDVGLLRRRLSLPYQLFLSQQDIIQTYRGAIVENFVLSELLAIKKEPYFWRSGNTAEIDFIFQNIDDIIPVEVKAATNTHAKSYRLFAHQYQPKKGFKISLKNIAVNDVEHTKTISLPLYMTFDIDYFLGKMEN